MIDYDLLDQTSHAPSYAAAEAIYHYYGGKNSKLTPHVSNGVWYLKDSSGKVIDPSGEADDSQGRPTGFHTNHASPEAKELVGKMRSAAALAKDPNKPFVPMVDSEDPWTAEKYNRGGEAEFAAWIPPDHADEFAKSEGGTNEADRERWKTLRAVTRPIVGFRAYKNSPHNPMALFLKYAVHRIENEEFYKHATPVQQKMFDEGWLKHHQQGSAADKNGHVTVDDLHDTLRKNPHYIGGLKAHQAALHKLLNEYSDIKMINGEPHIHLARGSVANPDIDHTLASYADAQHTVDSFSDGHVHHHYVPLKNVWYSYDAGPQEATSGNFGNENEFLVSHHPRIEVPPEERAFSEGVKYKLPRAIHSYDLNNIKNRQDNDDTFNPVVFKVNNNSPLTKEQIESESPEFWNDDYASSIAKNPSLGDIYNYAFKGLNRKQKGLAASKLLGYSNSNGLNNNITPEQWKDIVDNSDYDDFGPEIAASMGPEEVKKMYAKGGSDWFFHPNMPSEERHKLLAAGKVPDTYTPKMIQNLPATDAVALMRAGNINPIGFGKDLPKSKEMSDMYRERVFGADSVASGNTLEEALEGYTDGHLSEDDVRDAIKVQNEYVAGNSNAVRHNIASANGFGSLEAKNPKLAADLLHEGYLHYVPRKNETMQHLSQNMAAEPTHLKLAVIDGLQSQALSEYKSPSIEWNQLPQNILEHITSPANFREDMSDSYLISKNLTADQKKKIFETRPHMSLGHAGRKALESNPDLLQAIPDKHFEQVATDIFHFSPANLYHIANDERMTPEMYSRVRSSKSPTGYVNQDAPAYLDAYYKKLNPEQIADYQKRTGSVPMASIKDMQGFLEAAKTDNVHGLVSKHFLNTMTPAEWDHLTKDLPAHKLPGYLHTLRQTTNAPTYAHAYVKSNEMALASGVPDGMPFIGNALAHPEIGLHQFDWLVRHNVNPQLADKALDNILANKNHKPASIEHANWNKYQGFNPPHEYMKNAYDDQETGVKTKKEAYTKFLKAKLHVLNSKDMPLGLEEPADGGLYPKSISDDFLHELAGGKFELKQPKLKAYVQKIAAGHLDSIKAEKQSWKDLETHYADAPVDTSKLATKDHSEHFRNHIAAQKGLTRPGMLKKGILGAVAGITMAMSPGLKAGFDKVNPPTANVQKKNPVQAKWTPDGLHPDLIPIAHLESSFGRNMNHVVNTKGEFHTAHGPVGFKPSTAHEEWKKTNSLKEQFPGLEDPADFTKAFKSNWKLYNMLASSHFLRLKQKHGNTSNAAFAWRWGTGAASRATPEQIKADGYVTNYNNLAATVGLQKSEQVPLIKMAIEKLKPGKPVADTMRHKLHGMQRFGQVHDYTHLLPKKLRDEGYALAVGTNHEYSRSEVRARIYNHKHQYDGMYTDLGGVKAQRNNLTNAIVDISHVNEGHQGKSLGMHAYEALYAHMFHHMGVKSVGGEEHSTLAARTHQKLANKHKLDYPYKDKKIGVGRPNDAAFGVYDYDLKSQ